MKRLGFAAVVGLLLLGGSGFAQGVDDEEFIEEFLATKGLFMFPLRVPSVFDMTGGGARAQGMGKAFLAVSDDVSALSWNPAGLYGQEKPMLGFSYGAFAPKTDFDLTNT